MLVLLLILYLTEKSKNNMYRLNPFVRIYERENVKALFNMLNLNTLYLTEEMYNNILSEPNKQLLEEKFVVTPDFNALEYFQQQSPKQENNNISVVYFLLTSVCNFKCKYCFVESRIEKHDNAFMTKEIAEKGLQLLTKNLENPDDEVSVVFYGGEPFLNFEVMKYVVKRAKELNINAKYVIVSNGSVINEDVINFLKKNKVEIGISLDGLESTNDTMRIDHNNKGTYQKIMSTISELKKNEIQVSVSCTLSTHNIGKPEEILAVLNEYNIRGFGYNLPAENGNVVISSAEKQVMVRNLIKAEDLIFDKRIFEDRVINRRLKSFVEKTQWIKDCAGYGQQIVIAPAGEVGVCHGMWPDAINKKAKTYYDVDVNYEGKISDHPSWQEWFNRTPYNMPQCWNCEAISLCGGGCAKNAFLRAGSIWDIDEDICILMKEFVPWIIWKYFEVKVKPEFDKKD